MHPRGPLLQQGGDWGEAGASVTGEGHPTSFVGNVTPRTYLGAGQQPHSLNLALDGQRVVGLNKKVQAYQSSSSDMTDLVPQTCCGRWQQPGSQSVRSDR
jgi:hypothetical protein